MAGIKIILLLLSVLSLSIYVNAVGQDPKENLDGPIIYYGSSKVRYQGVVGGKEERIQISLPIPNKDNENYHRSELNAPTDLQLQHCPKNNGIFPSPDGDYTKYILCQEGDIEVVHCSPGLAFNPKKYGCDWPQNIVSAAAAVPTAAYAPFTTLSQLTPPAQFLVTPAPLTLATPTPVPEVPFKVFPTPVAFPLPEPVSNIEQNTTSAPSFTHDRESLPAQIPVPFPIQEIPSNQEPAPGPLDPARSASASPTLIFVVPANVSPAPAAIPPPESVSKVSHDYAPSPAPIPVPGPVQNITSDQTLASAAPSPNALVPARPLPEPVATPFPAPVFMATQDTASAPAFPQYQAPIPAQIPVPGPVQVIISDQAAAPAPPAPIPVDIVPSKPAPAPVAIPLPAPVSKVAQYTTSAPASTHSHASLPVKIPVPGPVQLIPSDPTRASTSSPAIPKPYAVVPAKPIPTPVVIKLPAQIPITGPKQMTTSDSAPASAISLPLSHSPLVVQDPAPSSVLNSSRGNLPFLIPAPAPAPVSRVAQYTTSAPASTHSHASLPVKIPVPGPVQMIPSDQTRASTSSPAIPKPYAVVPAKPIPTPVVDKLPAQIPITGPKQMTTSDSAPASAISLPLSHSPLVVQDPAPSSVLNSSRGNLPFLIPAPAPAPVSRVAQYTTSAPASTHSHASLPVKIPVPGPVQMIPSDQTRASTSSPAIPKPYAVVPAKTIPTPVVDKLPAQIPITGPKQMTTSDSAPASAISLPLSYSPLLVQDPAPSSVLNSPREHAPFLIPNSPATAPAGAHVQAYTTSHVPPAVSYFIPPRPLVPAATLNLTPSKPPVNSEICPNPFGFFPMSDGECSKYMLCQEGKSTVMNCPSGLVFNPDMEACDWPENVPQCSPNVFKEFICPEAPLEEDGSPSDLVYKYKYGKQCRTYVACHKGYPRLLNCDAGMAFDETAQACIYEEYVLGCESNLYTY